MAQGNNNNKRKNEMKQQQKENKKMGVPANVDYRSLNWDVGNVPRVPILIDLELDLIANSNTTIWFVIWPVE